MGTNSIERVPERSKVKEFKYITEEWEKQGVRIEEEGLSLIHI